MQSATAVGGVPVRWRNCFCYQKEAPVLWDEWFCSLQCSSFGSSFPAFCTKCYNVTQMFCLEVETKLQQGETHEICRSMCCCPPLVHVLSDCECQWCVCVPETQCVIQHEKKKTKDKKKKEREAPLHHNIHEFMPECFSDLAESPWLFESVDRLKETPQVFMFIDFSINPFQDLFFLMAAPLNIMLFNFFLRALI